MSEQTLLGPSPAATAFPSYRDAPATRWLAALRLQARLVVRSWLYPLLILAVGGVAYLFGNGDDRSAQALLQTTMGSQSLALCALIALLLAANSASRSRRSRFDELEASLPSGGEVLIGSWLGTWLSTLPLLIGPLVVPALQGPASSWLAGLPIYLGESALTLAFMTALGWTLAYGLRLKPWSYPLLAAIWLVGYGASVFTGLRSSAVFLLSFARTGALSFSDLWGRLVMGPLPRWFNLFYLGLALALLAVLLLRQRARRTAPSRAWLPVLLASALVLSAFSGSRFITIRDGWQATAEQEPPSVLAGAPAVQGGGRLAVDSYDISLDLRNAARPAFRASLQLRNAGSEALDELVFALNPELAVDQASLPFTRDGNRLSFTPPKPLAPGDSLALSLSYAAALSMPGMVLNDLQLTDFVLPQGVRLSPAAAWYPLAEGTGAWQHPQGQPWVYPSLPPSRVRLQVLQDGEGMPFGSNLPRVGQNSFASEDAGWIYLFGSPNLVEEQDGAITLLVAKDDLPRVRSYTPQFNAAFDFFRRFFPQSGAQGLLLIVVGEESGLPDFPLVTPPSDRHVVIATSRYMLHDLTLPGAFPMTRVSLLGTGILGDLISLERSGLGMDPYPGEPGEPDQSSTTPVRSIITNFLWQDYLAQGDAAILEQAVESASASQPTGLWDESERPAMLSLLQVYQQKGKAGLVSVIEQMVAHQEELSQMNPQAAATWILEVGHAG
jgi:hypothetical protein